MEIAPGDTVYFKKKHPCGGSRWEVIAVGADIRLKCCTCARYILLPRSGLERRIRTVHSGAIPPQQDGA